MIYLKTNKLQTITVKCMLYWPTCSIGLALLGL